MFLFDYSFGVRFCWMMLYAYILIELYISSEHYFPACLGFLEFYISRMKKDFTCSVVLLTEYFLSGNVFSSSRSSLSLVSISDVVVSFF